MKNSNEKLVHDFYQALEGYDFLTLKSLCSSDFVFYSQIDNPIHGVDGFIAAYVVFEGIHNNEMHGYKPTGKKVRISLMMLLTIEGGKIKEKRAHFDYNDIVRQIS